MPENQRPQRSDTLGRQSTLEEGSIELLGRMPNSSNGTFLAKVSTKSDEALGIYKPLRGERPLWDFPGGLYRREAAAFELSRYLGCDIIPPTVIREDGPFGQGSLQLFIDADFSKHYFDLYDRQDLAHQLISIATFDIVANNSDRKGGHILIDDGGYLWGIDNGLCFHEDPKLRTVIWEFGGNAIPEYLTVRLTELTQSPPDFLGALLEESEISAMIRRTQWLLQDGVLPDIDPEDRHYPWPII